MAAVHRKESAPRILAAIEKDSYFQMKLASVEALSAMKEQAFSCLLDGVKSQHYAVREVSVRALAIIGAMGSANGVFPTLFRTITNPEEDERVRCHALEGVVGIRQKIGPDARQQLVGSLINLSSADHSIQVQLRAAWGLGYFYVLTQEADREKMVQCLTCGFRAYGDECRRSDAAYGWRLFGNALLMCHERGRTQLESMRTQKNDRWLAWLAYEVVYLPHRHMKMALIDESEAIERHEKYAPAFPGYRT